VYEGSVGTTGRLRERRHLVNTYCMVKQVLLDMWK